MTSSIAPVRLGGARRVGVASVITRSIAERRTMAVLVGAGVGALTMAMAPLFGSLEEVLADAMHLFPEGVVTAIGGLDMATPEGWLNAEVFSVTAPVGVLAMAIIIGARALGGEEEGGTLDLLLANPVSRTRVVVDKLLGMAALVTIACGLIFLGTFLGDAIAGTGIPLANMAAVNVHLALLGISFGAIAVALGAATGRFRPSAIIAAVLAVVAWLTNAFLPLSDTLAEVAKASPWYYYSSAAPIAHGFAWGHLLVLAAVAAVAGTVAVAIFRRRDLAG